MIDIVYGWRHADCHKEVWASQDGALDGNNPIEVSTEWTVQSQDTGWQCGRGAILHSDSITNNTKRLRPIIFNSAGVSTLPWTHQTGQPNYQFQAENTDWPNMQIHVFNSEETIEVSIRCAQHNTGVTHNQELFVV